MRVAIGAGFLVIAGRTLVFAGLRNDNNKGVGEGERHA
jgi:hypothetical protein